MTTDTRHLAATDGTGKTLCSLDRSSCSELPKPGGRKCQNCERASEF